jgi:flagellar hook-basal body complex protein FliE
MAFSIPPVAGVTPTAYVELPDLEPGEKTKSVDNGSGFAATLGGVVDGAQALQGASNELAVAAVTGDLTDIHDASLAATRAQVTLELVAAVRNKGVDAFNEIMRMQA